MIDDLERIVSGRVLDGTIVNWVSCKIENRNNQYYAIVDITDDYNNVSTKVYLLDTSNIEASIEQIVHKINMTKILGILNEELKILRYHTSNPYRIIILMYEDYDRDVRDEAIISYWDHIGMEIKISESACKKIEFEYNKHTDTSEKFGEILDGVIWEKSALKMAESVRSGKCDVLNRLGIRVKSYEDIEQMLTENMLGIDEVIRDIQLKIDTKNEGIQDYIAIHVVDGGLSKFMVQIKVSVRYISKRVVYSLHGDIIDIGACKIAPEYMGERVLDIIKKYLPKNWSISDAR